MEYIELGLTINPQQNIIIKIPNHQKGDEIRACLWNKPLNEALCDHFHEIGTLSTWLEYEKTTPGIFCPVCKDEKSVKDLISENFFVSNSANGDFTLTMAALLQEKMSLLSEYAFSLFATKEKTRIVQEISGDLDDNALSLIASFKRSVHYTETKGQNLFIAILRDLGAKKTFILRYHDKREAFELKQQKRAVIEKNNLLENLIALEFEAEISGRTLQWSNLFSELNKCFIDFIEILFNDVPVVTNDISVAALLKGQYCMKLAFLTGKELDKFILFKPGLFFKTIITQ